MIVKEAQGKVMTIEEYTSAVLAKLPDIPEAFDLEATKRCIAKCYEDGFPVIGAINYCKCLEHVNPNIDEDYALKRMKELSYKYRKVNYKMGWGGFGN